MTDEEVFDRNRQFHPWFVSQFRRIIEQEKTLVEAKELTAELLRESKRMGFGDRADCAASQHQERERRSARCASPSVSAAVYGRVDTCSAEFVAKTPYLYSTYETESEADITD
ncbi:MAG: hypothetical protein QM784_26860 [Polyangiaceae bacterium]